MKRVILYRGTDKLTCQYLEGDCSRDRCKHHPETGYGSGYSRTLYCGYVFMYSLLTNISYKSKVALSPRSSIFNNRLGALEILKNS